MTAIVAEAPALLLPEPVGLQYAWLDSPCSRKVGRVGRRGTKTRFDFLAAVHGHGPGWEDGNPKFPGILQGVDVVWIAQTYTNLTTVLWREEIEPRFGPLEDAGLAKLNKTDHDVKLYGLGTLMLRSGEPDAIRSVRGVGKRLGGVIIDEAAWLALKAALQDVILPACLDNDAWIIITSTTNCGPDGDYDDVGRPMVPSYFNQLCGQIQRGERGPDWMEFTGTAYDNPTLTPKAIDELVAEYTPGSVSLEQEVFAKLLEPGAGLALPGISEARHMVPAFTPDAHWNRFASFDWGFHHPWSFGGYVVDEDGQVYKRDTIIGRLDLPEQIDAKVRAAGFDPRAQAIHAGGDIWRARMKKGEFAGPTIAEELQKLGWALVPANDARVAGLNNLRRYTHVDPAKPGARPRFLWMDTPGNKTNLAQCRAMTLDPKNPEDALKVDADSGGRGGDDTYDETRYGLMSRPIQSITLPKPDEEGKSLGYDYEKGRPRERETGDQAMEKLMGVRPTERSGRYRVPVRRV